MVMKQYDSEDNINKAGFIEPTFYIFTDEYIDDKLLKDLKNIRFE